MVSITVIISRAALLVTFALLALALLLAVPPAGAQTVVDYDGDDDGLIDLTTPAQFDAIRHDPNGNGDATDTAYVNAFPNRQTGSTNRMGCPSGTCTGYELRADIDLSGHDPFTPIPSWATTLRGNGHSITNLNISVAGYAGLFVTIASGGFVREVGLVAPAVRSTTTGSGQRVGGFAATIEAGGQVYHSFVRGGTVQGEHSAEVGGIAGRNAGAIRASYSTVTANSNNRNGLRIGALVGYLQGTSSGGRVVASYSAGVVNVGTGNNVRPGRFIGSASSPTATATNSYCDSTLTGPANCVGERTGNAATAVTALTSRELQRPTGYESIYANWNVDTDGDSNPDDPWAFGGDRTYPLLKADKDDDGTATCEEFGGQPCYREPVPPRPPPYNWRADHPEIYQNARYEITASCAVMTTGEGDDAVSTATITFDLAEYNRPITLALSRWDRTHFRSLPSLGIAMPELRREGQTATVEVVTDPARTRFRLDGQYGLNLVLGYADCHTDDS